MEILQDGDVFGEQALLMNAPRSTSAKSLAETTALALTADKFQALIDSAPALRWKLRESATIGEYRKDEASAGEVSPWAKFRHDLLTPVNHIMGYGDILSEEMEAEDAARIPQAGRELQAAIAKHPPPGRMPLSGAMPLLREAIETPLQAIDEAVGNLQKAAGSEQTAADLARVGTAVTNLAPCSTTRPAKAPRHARKRRPILLRLPKAQGKGTSWWWTTTISAGSCLPQAGAQRLPVSSAADGSTALKMVAAAQFNLVLLDVMMPDIDGISVLGQWQAAEKLAKLPVIVTSAMDQVESAVRCIELGPVDYLTKPFDPVLLRARIRASIQRVRERQVLPA